MLNRKFAVPSLVVATLLCVQVAGVEAANGVPDPCNSSATSAVGSIFACPQGDGDNLAARGLTINVTLLDSLGAPCVGVPAADIWLIGCFDLLNLCGQVINGNPTGRGAIGASAPTDINGQTTITDDLAAGGCDMGGLRVVVGVWNAQGVLEEVPIGRVCGDPCVPVMVRTADFNANGMAAEAVDFAFFVTGYPVDPAVNDCRDFNNDGVVGIVDFAKYVAHYLHVCN